MQLSAMAAAVKRDTPLGSWPHPRLFPRTERALAVLLLGSTPAVWMKGPGLFATKREIRGLGGFCITPENNSSSYESSTCDPSRVVVSDEMVKREGLCETAGLNRSSWRCCVSLDGAMLPC